MVKRYKYLSGKSLGKKRRKRERERIEREERNEQRAMKRLEIENSMREKE